ncbi:MAG TPA: FGGY family carbohydrate kinase [Chitinophagales bacterium]|nr:FGGY family carbohydrate kinase [Chitinophagales bacterium]
MTHTNLKCVLAIDLGSSGPKVSVVNQQGEILATRSGVFHNIYTDNGKGVEQDADVWWQVILMLAKEVIDESGAAQNIVAISNCSQYFSSVPVDKEGNATYHAIMWEDTRAAKYINQVMGGWPSVMGYNIFKAAKWLGSVGIPPLLSGIDGGSHMLLLKNEKPDAWQKTYKVLEPSDYLSLKFTGRFCTNENTGFGYALIKKAAWSQGTFDKKLINTLGLDFDKFPDIVPVGANLGTVTAEVAGYLGLRNDVQVFSGIVDTSAFMVGCGAFNEYDMAIDLGTTLSTGVVVSKRIIDVFTGVFSLTSPVTGKYSMVGELGSGTKALNFLIHNFLRADDELTKINEDTDLHYAAIADKMAAESPVGSNGVVFMPWIFGSTFPEQDANIRGGFINLNPVATRSDMVRAVFESYALALKWSLQITESRLNRKIEKVNLVGGGALWHTAAQIFADALQIPVHIPEHPRQTNTKGVAFMCFNNLGITTYSDISSTLKTAKIFQPQQQNFSFYTKRLIFYKRLYKTMRPLYDSLNGASA